MAKNAVLLRFPQVVLFKIQNYTNPSDGRKCSVFLVLTFLYLHVFRLARMDSLRDSWRVVRYCARKLISGDKHLPGKEVKDGKEAHLENSFAGGLKLTGILENVIFHGPA